MPAGRPLKSIVRERLVEILYLGGKMTAYDAHKHYIALFGATTRRNVYYQLEKGAVLNLFSIKQVVEEKGDYSWGETTRKVYYVLGKAALPKLDKHVKKYFDSINAEFRTVRKKKQVQKVKPLKEKGETNDSNNSKNATRRKTSTSSTRSKRTLKKRKD